MSDSAPAADQVREVRFALPVPDAPPAPPAIALPPGSPKGVSDEDAALFLKEDKLTDADKAKRDQIRAQVISEIQSTERSYVQALDALQQSFVTPLKQKMADSKHFQDISPAYVDAMCSNLETLTNFHHMFIQSLAQVQPVAPATPHVAAVAATATAAAAVPGDMPPLPAPPSIPSVFLKFSEFFRLYIPYLNGYEKSLNTFNELRKHKKFAEWLAGDVKMALKAHALATNSSQLDLLSYMIQPVQRVPRYVLLLKELKRQTSPYHPEFGALNDALQAVQRVASVINEGQRAIENMSKLMAVQHRIVGEFETLIQPHRRLIREGVVTAAYTKGIFSTIRVRRSVFFLFSDLLMWTSEEFKFKGSIDLTPAKLAPKTSTSFVIDTATRVVQVTLDTEAEARSWFEDIDKVVCQLQNEREKLRQRARVQKSRNLNGTANKDAVHKLVTQGLQNLQGLGGAGAGAGAAGSEASSSGEGTSFHNGGSVSHSAASSSVAAAAYAGTVGTIGRTPGTLGHRSGRKWDEALDASEQKLRKEQEHLAAFSREKISDDTFAEPTATTGDTGGSGGGSGEGSSSPPPAESGVSSSGTPLGEKKYQARFVSRRGRSTLGKNDCLCTIILIHKDCPKHGEKAQLAAQDDAQHDAQQ